MVERMVSGVGKKEQNRKAGMKTRNAKKMSKLWKIKKGRLTGRRGSEREEDAIEEDEVGQCGVGGIKK